MKKIFFILLCFSQTVFAQHKKKSVEKILVKQQLEYTFEEGELLNDDLKGSKWFFNLKSFDENQIDLDKDRTKPDVLSLIDAKNFQININQKNCKSIIKGSYQFMKETGESAVFPVGYNTFRITSGFNNKCTEKLLSFLTTDLDVSFDEKKSTIQVKKREVSPPMTVPGF